LVRSFAVKFQNGSGEFRIRRHGTEQRHRRAEFEVVGSAQDFAYGAAVNSIDESGALPETVPEAGMP